MKIHLPAVFDVNSRVPEFSLSKVQHVIVERSMSNTTFQQHDLQKYLHHLAPSRPARVS